MIIGGKKILSEAETRKSVLEVARFYGCEKEAIQIFDKYDKLLRGCTNDGERQAIALMGNEELHFLVSNTPNFISVGNKIIGRE